MPRPFSPFSFLLNLTFSCSLVVGTFFFFFFLLLVLAHPSSILRPCCEALERVSRAEEGRAAFEERGTGGVLLATIRFVYCIILSDMGYLVSKRSSQK